MVTVGCHLTGAIESKIGGLDNYNRMRMHWSGSSYFFPSLSQEPEPVYSDLCECKKKKV